MFCPGKTGGGVWGSSPRKKMVYMVWNCVILDNINMEMGLSWKPGIVCMTGDGDNPLNLEAIRIFQKIYTMYDTGERSEKIYQNKIKTTFGPPLLHVPIKPPHKTPTSDKSQGGPDPRSPPPPLDPRMPWAIATCENLMISIQQS